MLDEFGCKLGEDKEISLSWIGYDDDMENNFHKKWRVLKFI